MDFGQVEAFVQVSAHRSFSRAAEVLHKLRAEGRDLGLFDALVVGIALASGCDAIVTRVEGYRPIRGLRVETY